MDEEFSVLFWSLDVGTDMIFCTDANWIVRCVKIMIPN